MNYRILIGVAACCLWTWTALGVDWDNFKREDYEESAGGSSAILANPVKDIYGLSVGDGTWLKNTPVFGDYAVGFLYNGIEDALYADMGLTIRLMPHWRVAPFVGSGGGYYYPIAKFMKNDTLSAQDFKDQGDSYWGGHVETGVRVWTPGRRILFEVMGRYVWSSLSGDRSYWLGGLSLGLGSWE